jgi:predicted dehydrogenase
MKVAVLGLGFMGSTHLKALRNVPGATLAAIYSKDERARNGDLSQIQGNLGGPGEQFDFSNVAKYSDIDALIADREIEAVDICLPTFLHAPVALAALRAGKHVLVEKPMALDAMTADELVLESVKAGRVLMAAHVLRFFPMYQALRETLPGLGTTRDALFRRRCAAPAWSKWLEDKSKSGGGVFDLLIHDIDMALWLFGVPVRVSAVGHEDLARGIDVIHAQLFYEDGLNVTVTGGWHHPKSYPFSMEFTVVADEGTVEYSSAGRVPTLYSKAGTESPMKLSEHDGYAEEIRYFVDCATANRPPELCMPETSARAVKLALLLNEARKRNGEMLECHI